ncbi:MAG: phosphomannomutase/phosphoglucomutase, partial [Candidatus Nealsonbacteria bacterium]|nr:phosphomannomutase/phosphoglucomutase [Candidatus Nealsonbacteria bacterium]
MINESIFKAYDVRGIYPSDLNDEIAKSVGQAFTVKTKAKKIAVGRDGRLSSEALFKAVVSGITSQGADVYDIGLSTTECLYFSVGFYDDIDAGVMITASHNPKEYGGIKMVKKEGGAVTILRGIDLLEAVKQEMSVSSSVGNIEKKDIWADY